MHAYNLVWLKSDRIGFFIVELKHPDYSIDSRITPACIRSSGLDRILRSAQVQDFSLFSVALLPLVEMVAAPPSVPGYDVLRPNNPIFSPACVLG